MKSFRNAGTVFWGFNGGEALVREDIGKLIDYSKSLGMYVSLATNGTMLKDRIGEIKNVDLVSVSIDGDKKIQDNIRCNSFDRIIEGLDALKGNSITMNFMTVIGKHNLDSTDFILELAEKYNARVFFQPIRVQKEDTTGKSKPYYPTKQEMQDAIDCIIAAKRKGMPVASSIKYLELMKKCWPDGMPDVECWAGRICCFLTPEGYVTACCDTLAYAMKTPECGTSKYGAKAFQNIPKYRCATCYSSIPLETNLMMSAIVRHPLELKKQALPHYISN